MKASKWLRGTLIVMGVYTAIIGVLFLLAPGVAEGAFGIELPDQVLTPLYGQVVLSIVLLTFLIAADPTRFARLIWVLVFQEAGHVAVFAYVLATGLQTFQQAGPPLIVNSILLVALLAFRGQAKASG